MIASVAVIVVSASRVARMVRGVCSGMVQMFESVMLVKSAHVVRYWLVWLVTCMLISTSTPVVLSQ